MACQVATCPACPWRLSILPIKTCTGATTRTAQVCLLRPVCHLTITINHDCDDIEWRRWFSFVRSFFLFPFFFSSFFFPFRCVKKSWGTERRWKSRDDARISSFTARNPSDVICRTWWIRRWSMSYAGFETSYLDLRL